MARMAALSGPGSFAQAVTTWDKSRPKRTRFCASPCASTAGFASKTGVLHRFESCSAHHSPVFDPAGHSGSGSESMPTQRRAFHSPCRVPVKNARWQTMRLLPATLSSVRMAMSARVNLATGRCQKPRTVRLWRNEAVEPTGIICPLRITKIR